MLFKNGDKELTEVWEVLKGLGVKFLDKPYEIKRNDKKLWLSEIYYKDMLQALVDKQVKDEDLKIAITHYPMDKGVFEGIHGEKLTDYDLILAGNYYGGQWRIPFYGAFFISDVNGNCFCPKQERVCGLTEWNGFKQYVSRGLGASGDKWYLRFRLFNAPEINVIKLVKA